MGAHDPQFRLKQIGFVMLGVQDLPRAVAFYRDKLGLSVQSEVEKAFVFLDTGGVMLALSAPLARASSQIAGAAEVVFSVDDVTAAYEALLARGVRFTRPPHNVAGPNWVANFEDPDGHKLALLGPQYKT